MSTSTRLLQRLCWLTAGLLLGVSFLAATVKFSAQLSTMAQLLEVGRLQFTALHLVEWLLWPVLAAWAWLGRHPKGTFILLGSGLALFLVQALALTPVLDRRLVLTIAGETLPDSPHHWIYAAIEVFKVAILVWAGTLRPKSE